MRYFDISPLIKSSMAVFPGDTPFEQKWLMEFDNNHHLSLSSITTTLHLGAHADAPKHYHAQGKDIASRDLEFYCGPCQVLDIAEILAQKAAEKSEKDSEKDSAKDFQITPDFLNAFNLTTPRILFKTNTFPDPYKWRSDFAYFHPDTIDELAARGVRLVGIDTPSVDHATAKELSSHHKIFKHDMAVLEGLTFQDVPGGNYNLMCLPLRIEGAEASPVRAILLPY